MTAREASSERTLQVVDASNCGRRPQTKSGAGWGAAASVTPFRTVRIRPVPWWTLIPDPRSLGGARPRRGPFPYSGTPVPERTSKLIAEGGAPPW
jgi:hypothetical protein